MSAGVAGALAFNLLFNAMGSYGLAALLSSLAARLLRVPAGRWRQLFLILPLAKVAWDLVRGVPRDSFFWSKVAGARQDLGQFRIGVGLHHFVPSIQLALGALKSGVTYPQSVAELAATLLSRRIGPRVPGAVAAALSAVALSLVLVRAARVVRAAPMAEHRRRAARVVGQRALRRRAVDVVVADDYDGVPFLGGVLRPYVCFSRVAYEALTEPERDAVVSHELGHLAHHDLFLFAAVGLFADLFWFVPTLRARCRAVVGEAEVCADLWALAAGASAPALAAALVRAAELSRPGVAPALGLVRGQPLLSRRVHALLGWAAAREPCPRSRVEVFRRIATALVVAMVLGSTAFGNH
jgi:hypothetical protein